MLCNDDKTHFWGLIYINHTMFLFGHNRFIWYFTYSLCNICDYDIFVWTSSYHGNVIWLNETVTCKLRKLYIIPLSTSLLEKVCTFSQSFYLLTLISFIIPHKDISTTIYGNSWITHDLVTSTYWNFGRKYKLSLEG